MLKLGVLCFEGYLKLCSEPRYFINVAIVTSGVNIVVSRRRAGLPFIKINRGILLDTSTFQRITLVSQDYHFWEKNSRNSFD